MNTKARNASNCNLRFFIFQMKTDTSSVVRRTGNSGLQVKYSSSRKDNIIENFVLVINHHEHLQTCNINLSGKIIMSHERMQKLHQSEQNISNQTWNNFSKSYLSQFQRDCVITNLSLLSVPSVHQHYQLSVAHSWSRALVPQQLQHHPPQPEPGCLHSKTQTKNVLNCMF